MTTPSLKDEQSLTQMKAMEAMRKNFVANVSHELKTPITLIKGFLETLLGGAMNNKEELVEFLTIIQNHANRLDAIIEDLLSLSRIEQESDNGLIETRPDNLVPIIKKAIAACEEKAAKKAIRIHFNTDGDCMSPVNASLLEQAIINLIDNAIKYSLEDSLVEVTLSCENDEHIMSVTDQGRGIPEKHVPRLFERFYRVDKARSREMGGTGLGLAIVKHIVQAHAGTVSVQSELDKGSTFSIALPVAN